MDLAVLNAAPTPSRDLPAPSVAPARALSVGAGRVGRAIAAGLRAAGHVVDGPVGRQAVPIGDVVLLCVPDRAIGSAAGVVAGAPFVGHTSGATSLAALDAARDAGSEVFSLHPLQTIVTDDGRVAGHLLRGVGCAVAGSSPEAVSAAARVADSLGMRPFGLAEQQRPLYHAAASVASNFLVTLEWLAETLLAEALTAAPAPDRAGPPEVSPEAARELLAPLVRASVESWAARGPERALTGPVARGDESTVEAQRRAIAVTRPELLAVYDALVEQTRALASQARELAA